MNDGFACREPEDAYIQKAADADAENESRD